MHKRVREMLDTQVEKPQYLLAEVLLMGLKVKMHIRLENLTKMKKKLVFQQ